MANEYTIKDVTADLKSLIELTGLFTTDDNGFVIDSVTKERYLHRLDANDTGREIALFQDPMPKGDVLFFNPFSEGFGKKTPAVQFFYRMLRIRFNVDFRTALMYMMRLMNESKQAAAKNEEYSISSQILKMSSVPIDRKTSLFDTVDDKLLTEFETLFDRVNDECIQIPYYHPTMTAVVRCEAITDPKWDEKFGKDIRKKTLLAFKSAIMGVLGIDAPEKLEKFSVKYTPDLKTSAKLYATMSVYLTLYSQFNDVLAEAFDVTSEENKPSVQRNLGELAEVIERFPLAYAIAKHMIQPILPKTKVTDVATPDTSSLSMGSHGSGGSRFRRDDNSFSSNNRSSGGLSFAQPAQGGGSRFRRDDPVVTHDPFSPLVQPVSPSPFNNTSPFNGGGSPFNGGSGFFNGGGLNFNPPSNFGSPGTSLNYFR